MGSSGVTKSTKSTKDAFKKEISKRTKTKRKTTTTTTTTIPKTKEVTTDEEDIFIIDKFFEIKLDNKLPTRSSSTREVTTVVLPMVDPNSVNNDKNDTIIISDTNKVQYNLQHGYIMNGTDVKNIPGYEKFKEDFTKAFNSLPGGLRSGGSTVSFEDTACFRTKYFNYGSPWLSYNNDPTNVGAFDDEKDNDFFPHDNFFGCERVQVCQGKGKHWNMDVDKFVRYFTKNYVYIYDEYKNLIPYSICALEYTDGNHNSRGYHHDPTGYTAIVGFNFRGTAQFQLESYTDVDNYRHDEQVYDINDDDCYVMLGYDTCRNRCHGAENCSAKRFVPIIKYIEKNEFLQRIIKSEKVKNYKEKMISIELAVDRLFKAIDLSTDY